jgi:hypothetical protein
MTDPLQKRNRTSAELRANVIYDPDKMRGTKIPKM